MAVLVVVAEEAPGAAFVEGEVAQGDEEVPEEDPEEAVEVEAVAFPEEGREAGFVEGSEAVARFSLYLLRRWGSGFLKMVCLFDQLDTSIFRNRCQLPLLLEAVCKLNDVHVFGQNHTSGLAT